MPKTTTTVNTTLSAEEILAAILKDYSGYTITKAAKKKILALGNLVVTKVDKTGDPKMATFSEIKIGDTVRVKSFGELLRVYGLNSIGNPKIPNGWSGSGMTPLCDTVLEISSAGSDGMWNAGGYTWPSDAFEGYRPA